MSYGLQLQTAGRNTQSDNTYSRQRHNCTYVCICVEMHALVNCILCCVSIFGSSFADWFKNCQFWKLLKTGARTLSLTRVLRNTEFSHSWQTGSFWNHGIHTVRNCTRPHWKLCVLVHTQTLSIFHTVSASATHKAAQPAVIRHHWWRTWYLSTSVTGSVQYNVYHYG